MEDLRRTCGGLVLDLEDQASRPIPVASPCILLDIIWPKLSGKSVLRPHTYGPAFVVAIGGSDGFTKSCDYANTGGPRGSFRNITHH